MYRVLVFSYQKTANYSYADINFYNKLISLDKSYFAHFELGVLYFNNNNFLVNKDEETIPFGS